MGGTSQVEISWGLELILYCLHRNLVCKLPPVTRSLCFYDFPLQISCNQRKWLNRRRKGKEQGKEPGKETGEEVGGNECLLEREEEGF